VLEVIIFGLDRFLYKKNNQTEFFLKKTETRLNRLVSVRFFRTKTGSNRFDSVFSVWVRFGSVFRFQTYKTELIDFFIILIIFFAV
jgi:hypothetical protein